LNFNLNAFSGLDWKVIFTGATVGVSLGLLMMYTNIFKAGSAKYVHSYESSVVQTDINAINSTIKTWITAHAIDHDTVAAYSQTVRNQIASHRVKIREIIAKYKAGQLTKDAFKAALRQEAKSIADELRIGLRPTGGSVNRIQLASSLAPLKKKLRDDILSEAMARIHRSS
jgi:hypothetical protein